MTDNFDQWCVVEIMGHKKFAGRVTEGAFGLVQIDVPESGPDLPAFTKLFGAAAIYGMTPCTEETARQFARYLRLQAFNAYELPSLALPAPERDPEWDADNDDLEADETYQATDGRLVLADDGGRACGCKQDMVCDVCQRIVSNEVDRLAAALEGLPITEEDLDAFVAAIGDAPARDPQLEEPCDHGPHEVCNKCEVTPASDPPVEIDPALYADDGMPF